LLLFDQLKPQSLMRPTRYHTIAKTVITKHRRRDALMQHVEIIFLRQTDRRAEDSSQFQVAFVALCGGLAQFVYVIGLNSLCSCHDQSPFTLFGAPPESLAIRR